MAEREFKPSPKLATKFYVWIALIFVLGFLPYVFLGFIPGAGWTYVAIFLAANALWIIIACALVPPYYRSISYLLRDDEVVVRRGILTRSEDVVPYRMVTNVALKRGPLDRLYGLGTLQVHTAGFSQQTAAESTLAGLANYQEVRELLMAQVHRQRRPLTAEGPGKPLEREDVPDILQGILDEVRGLRSDRKE